jgi:hypothetical protein
MILNQQELIVLLDGRYFSKTKSIDAQRLRSLLKNPSLQLRCVRITDLETSLSLELSADDAITVEDNIAIKYLHSLQNCFPKNTFSYSSGYLESIRISK